MMNPEGERPVPTPTEPPAEGELIPHDSGPYRSPYGWGHGTSQEPAPEQPPAWQHGHWNPQDGSPPAEKRSGGSKAAAAGGLGLMFVKLLSAAKFASASSSSSSSSR